jgi:nucleotide-binding universal stress UspA family protein
MSMSSIFSRILVAVDDSGPTRDVAVSLAARLAREHGGALFLCHCVNWFPLVAEVESSGAVVDPTPIVEGLTERGHVVLAQAVELAKRCGNDAVCSMVEGEPVKRGFSRSPNSTRAR